MGVIEASYAAGQCGWGQPLSGSTLFLPDLVQQIARNKQIDANRRERAHPAFRKWAKDLKQGVLQQLHETQVEQDFNHVLPSGLGYTTQSDVASDQPWTLTPKWNVPGSGEVDAALGKFRLDESGWVSGEPLVMVELKGAKVELDRKMPARNITPVQQRTSRGRRPVTGGKLVVPGMGRRRRQPPTALA